jgi:hypothetical protein
MTKFTIDWIDHGREPQNPPDPEYPDGIDLDCANGVAPTCFVVLPYPAKRCGHYLVGCQTCGLLVSCTTAGRVDDPRSITMACRRH